MLKKALAAAVLLSVATTSVAAYAAGATLGRGAPTAQDANGGKKKRTALWLALGGAAVAGGVAAASGGGSNSPEGNSSDNGD